MKRADEIKLMEQIREDLEFRTGEAVNVSMQDVQKPEGTMRGVSVRFEGDSYASVVYPDRYATMNLSTEMMASAMADAVIRGRGQVPSLPETEEMKDRLYLTLINGSNTDMLQGVPHIMYDKLAVVARCRVAENPNETMSFLIRDSHLPMLQMTAEEVLERAKKNTQERETYSVRTMGDIMRDMCGGMEPDYVNEITAMSQPDMFVITSARGLDGATGIIFPEVRQMIQDRVGDAILLPSSRHEWIAISKDSYSENAESLEEMVREINMTTVAPEDRLSDSIFSLTGTDFSLFSNEMAESMTESPVEVLSHGRAH